MGIQDHLTCPLKNLYAGQEATIRIGHGTMVWFKLVKQYAKCILWPCLFNLFAQYIMWNARLDEAHPGIKVEGEISITSDMQMIPPLCQSVKRELKNLLMKVREESEKAGLKWIIMASGPITSWQIDVETMTDFIFSGSRINCRWWLQPRN